MKRDAETVLNEDNFFYKLPKEINNPKIILDIGERTKFSTLGLAAIYPEAKIFSASGDVSNFLLDKNDLAYHDNIRVSYINLEYFDLSVYINAWLGTKKIVDYAYVSLGSEYDGWLNRSVDWSRRISNIRIRCTEETYLNLKKNLQRLGYDAWGHYDGLFHVVGQKNVFDSRDNG